VRLLFLIVASAILASCQTETIDDLRDPEVLVDGAAVSGSVDSDEQRIEQAMTFRLMEQRGAAIAILRPVLESDNEPLRKQALALTGVMEAQNGDLITAEDFLRRATAGNDAWPGFGQALSDLGVVLLRTGSEEEGLTALENARARLLADGNLEGAAVCERNIQTYRYYSAGQLTE